MEEAAKKASSSHDEPLSDAEVRLQFAYVLAGIREDLGDIREGLGSSNSAIKVLDDARKTHDERIVQLIEKNAKNEVAISGLKAYEEKFLRFEDKLLRLIERTIVIEYALPDIEDTISQHAIDVNGLGKVAHTADKLVRIALGILAVIGGSTLIYLFRHVSLVWVK